MTQLVLTRYLYNKEFVLESLENSILEGLQDESLFWGYEIYFSGFEEEVFQKCFEIFQIHYNNYKKLEKYLRVKEREWISAQDESKSDEILGIILKNICLRKRDLQREEAKREKYLIIDAHYIDKYRTRQIVPVWKTLSTLCIYDLRLISNKQIQIENDNVFDIRVEILRDNWLFYAGHSPIWKLRILENGGEIDLVGKKIIFKNEDSLEAFYEKYGFEPEEQSLKIQKRCLGI
jgi:hypothetical protein